MNHCFRLFILEQEGATYGPRATSGPRRAHFLLYISLSDRNLAREAPKKAQCGPRTKIVARPCSREYIYRFFLAVTYCYLRRSRRILNTSKKALTLLSLFHLEGLANLTCPDLSGSLQSLVRLPGYRKIERHSGIYSGHIH